jgi:hypothetical protein
MTVMGCREERGDVTCLGGESCSHYMSQTNMLVVLKLTLEYLSFESRVELALNSSPLLLPVILVYGSQLVGSSKTGLRRICRITHNWQSDTNIEQVSSNVHSFSLHMVSSVSKAGMQYAVLNGHNGQSKGWSNMTCMTYGPLNMGRE